MIVYPTGGGVGLIGMWKAFEELEAMGCIGSQRPRMIAAQAEGCAPIVRAFEQRAAGVGEVGGRDTVAAGLRVPKALGDFLILADICASGGEAVAVTDDELMAACREHGAHRRHLRRARGRRRAGGDQDAASRRARSRRDESVVLFNTGSGYKYWKPGRPRWPTEANPVRLSTHSEDRRRSWRWLAAAWRRAVSRAGQPGPAGVDGVVVGGRARPPGGNGLPADRGLAVFNFMPVTAILPAYSEQLVILILGANMLASAVEALGP